MERLAYVAQVKVEFLAAALKETAEVPRNQSATNVEVFGSIFHAYCDGDCRIVVEKIGRECLPPLAVAFRASLLQSFVELEYTKLRLQRTPMPKRVLKRLKIFEKKAVDEK